MKEITIRKAKIEDLDEILEIYVESGLDNQFLDLEKAKSIFIKMSQYPDYQVFVAFFEEKMVGTFALLIMENLAHQGTPSAVVEDVGVLPDFQGKGVGKMMMEFALNYAKENGCYKMSLSSNLKREKAHDFYEKLGFRKHGFSFLIWIE